MKKINVLAVFGILTLMGMPAAFAQDNDGETYGASFTTTTTTTTAVVAAMPFLLTTSSSSTGNSSTPAPKKRRRRRRRLRRQVQHNQQALHQLASIGGGQTLQDLASIYEVSREDMGIFGKHIRKYRVQIMGLTKTDSLTDAQVAQLDSILVSYKVEKSS